VASLELIKPTARPRTGASPRLAPAALRCRRKFLRFYPGGFRDDDYAALERDYKWQAHEQWEQQLNPATFRALLRDGKHAEVATRAVRIESRTNLLFSFEKIALRDAISRPTGARLFAEGLDAFLHGSGAARRKFERWVEVVGALPRRQTRVLTWPIVTVFGFIALPEEHVYLKPTVTRLAARAYGFPFAYASRPNWETYASLLDFARTLARDQRDLRPRDMIDLQSFIWVQGSDEYEG
jgi:hypothetical protein